MDILAPALLVLLILVLFFLATRWFWCWYWKINSRLATLEALHGELLHLRQINESVTASRITLEQIRDAVLRAALR
jgi:hypothetical protein